MVAFSVLIWYHSNLDFGGSQVAVAYIHPFTGGHDLSCTSLYHGRLYKCSIVEQAFNWSSSKLLENKPKQDVPIDAPVELDEYQLERPAATTDQELPTVTYSVVAIMRGPGSSY